jgi:TP901 family phage tail tape measure protein
MAAESTVRILFLGDSAQAIRSVSRLESSMSSLGRTTKLLAGAMGIALIGGLIAATKSAAEFQHQMELIHTQAGASTAEVDKMSKAVLGLARSVGTGPEDLAKGLFHIESAGIRGADALKILRAAAEGAKIGGADLEDTTNALIGAFKSGVKGAGSMEHAMAVLNATVGAGNMRMSDLTSAMGTGLLSAARGVGLSIQDVGAAVAELSVQNENASEAATRLQMAFLTMAAGTSKGDAALKAIGITQFQLAQDMRTKGLTFALQDLETHLKDSGKTLNEQNAIIADVFGRRSLKAILPLLQHLDDLRARQQQINDTTKNFGAAWVATQQTASFQLAKAKASIQAAAIPIGTLLLPALVEVADAAGNFANSVGDHMPQIKADFQSLSGIVGGLGTALGELGKVAISPAGVAGIVGLLAGVGTSKAVGGIASLAIKAGEASNALTGIGIAGMALSGLALPIAAGVGVLTGAIYLLSTTSSESSYQLGQLSQAMQGLVAASNEAGQAGRNLSQAHLNVKSTALAVRDAERAYAEAVRKSGKDSEDAQKAAVTLGQARLAHQQALADDKSATQANAAEQKKLNAALAEQTQNYNAAIQASQKQEKGMPAQAAAVQRFSDSMGNVASEAAAAARAIPASDKAAQNAEKNLHDAAVAAQQLADELGRIPTHKEIQIRVRIDRQAAAAGATYYAAPPGGQHRGRAAGGFIPGPSPGAPVPILAHAGEVILNRPQQMALGGPGAIASMFGFTGDEGPGFATGGFVTKRRRSGKSTPHGRRHHRGWRPQSKAAKAILSKLEEIDENESNADRAYGQLTRQFDISQEQFIRTDPATGVDYISKPDVDQRVSEIDQLITARNNYLDMLDHEKAELELAIKKLRAAVAALVKAIKKEKEAAAADAKKIRDLGRQLGHAKGSAQTRIQNQITATGNSRSKHLSNVGTLQSTLTGFRTSLGDVQENLRDTLPMDRRDVSLDIASLQTERKDVVGTTLPSSGAGTGTAGDSSAEIAALIAQVARLTQALSIQGAQSALIGSFAKGTLSVPETGLALVHAGEQIVPAGQTKGGQAGAPWSGDVNITLSGPLEPLAHFITATVDTPHMADRISVRIGQKADARARSGRYG